MASKNAEAGAVAGNSGGGATTATPTTVSQPAGAKPVVCFLGPITSYTHQVRYVYEYLGRISHMHTYVQNGLVRVTLMSFQGRERFF